MSKRFAWILLLIVLAAMGAVTIAQPVATVDPVLVLFKGCAIASSDRRAADASPRSPACRRSRAPSTWASRAADCSGRRTAARTGCRSPTARCRVGSMGVDRRRRLRSEHHLCRHRLGRRAQQRLHRPRRLQDRPTPARRGQFAGLYNAGQIGAVRIHPTESEHRLGRGHRRHLQAERRARRVQDDRRRQDLAQGAVRLRQRSAPWTSSCSRATRTSSTPGCRGSSASRGRSSAARARVASTRAPTAARR